jgi:CelD/BcsL family acetyltransferase involved in cellulose biosynthesis
MGRGRPFEILPWGRLIAVWALARTGPRVFCAFRGPVVGIVSHPVPNHSRFGDCLAISWQRACTNGWRAEGRVAMSGRSVAFGDLSVSALGSWAELLDQKEQYPSPFLAPEFSKAMNHVSGNVFVASVGRGGGAAFLPFQRRTLMPFIGDKVGGRMSDICGVIGGAQTHYREEEILAAAGLSVFCFDHWLQPGCPLPKKETVETAGTRVSFDSAEAYFSNLQKLDRKFVNEVHRLEGQLSEANGPLRFEWQSSRPQVELDRVIAEKRRQYAQSNVEDALAGAWPRALLKTLMETRSKDFEAVMSTIHCGDQWIASHFGLRYRNVLHIWFPVYNDDFRRFGPGHILLFKIFQQANALGVTQFDFGAGVSAYKKKYRGTDYSLAKGALKKANLTALAHTVAQSTKWRIQYWRRSRKQSAPPASKYR